MPNLINPNVHMCTGCPKARNWTAAGGWTCTVYLTPFTLMWYRHGKPCPMNPPMIEVKKGKFVNPIKQSKRGN